MLVTTLRRSFFALTICALATVCRADAPTSQPALPALIDSAVLHVDDQLSRMKDAGIVAGYKTADQIWLAQQVDDFGTKIHEYYATLKEKHQPVGRYNAMDITDTSDGAVYNFTVGLLQKRPAIGVNFQPAYAKADEIVPVVVLAPDLFDGWLDNVKATKAQRDRISAVIKTENARLAASGAVVARDKTGAALAAYIRQKGQSRTALWSVIGQALTPDQVRVLAGSMGAGSPDQDSIAEAMALLTCREQRGWTMPSIPQEAVADSDQINESDAVSDGRFSLFEAEDKKLIATAAVAKGQSIGFTFSPLGSLAQANDEFVPTDLKHHLYYWAPAASSAPILLPPGTRKIPVEVSPQ